MTIEVRVLSMVLQDAPVPPLPPTPPPEIIVQTGAPPWETLPPPVALLMFLALCAAGVLILYPIMRALGRRLEGHGGADAALRGEVEELRARVHELEAAHGRLGELEERIDFAERLLAQRNEPRLGAGGER